MLETILNSDVIFWMMGVVFGVAILCKIITTITLKRLVRAAEKMGKSNQKLMKLVKAKFEHAFMLCNRVDNVDAFVGKYLFEYRALGIRLYTYFHLGKRCIWILAILSLTGIGICYGEIGVDEQIFRYGVLGGGSVILLLFIRMSSNEEQQIQMIKTYMIDYLENVCAPRYSKQQALKYQKMEKAMQETVLEPVEEVKEEVIDPEMQELKILDPNIEEVEEEVKVQVQEEAVQEEAVKEASEKEGENVDKNIEETEKEGRVPQEVILREILEEFLA